MYVTCLRQLIFFLRKKELSSDVVALLCLVLFTCIPYSLSACYSTVPTPYIQFTTGYVCTLPVYAHEVQSPRPYQGRQALWVYSC